MAGPDIITSHKVQMPYYHQRAHCLLDRANAILRHALDAPYHNIYTRHQDNDILDARLVLRHLDQVLHAITGNGYEPETGGQADSTITEEKSKTLSGVSDEG